MKYDTEDDSSTVQCPTCGRGGFASVRGMKVHHARTHGESIAGVEVECAYCGAARRVDPHYKEKFDHIFCLDTDCRSNWMSENLRGEDHPQWVPCIERECNYCGATVELEAAYDERVEHTFCKDTDCRSNWMSENVRGEDHPSWVESIVDECAWCGDEIRRNPNRVRSERQFCDAECWGEWESENLVGDKLYNWEGGLSHVYGPNWHHQRRKCRERDGRRCQECGKTADENGRKLDVHHIEPKHTFIRDGGTFDWERANQLDNLVTLCPLCHRHWEKMAPLRPQVE